MATPRVRDPRGGPGAPRTRGALRPATPATGVIHGRNRPVRALRARPMCLLNGRVQRRPSSTSFPSVRQGLTRASERGRRTCGDALNRCPCGLAVRVRVREGIG